MTLWRLIERMLLILDCPWYESGFAREEGTRVFGCSCGLGERHKEKGKG